MSRSSKIKRAILHREAKREMGISARASDGSASADRPLIQAAKRSQCYAREGAGILALTREAEELGGIEICPLYTIVKRTKVFSKPHVMKPAKAKYPFVTHGRPRCNWPPVK